MMSMIDRASAFFAAYRGNGAMFGAPSVIRTRGRSAVRRWVEALTVARSSRTMGSVLPEPHTMVAEINREMERTRRYQRPMALIALHAVEAPEEIPREQVIAVAGLTLRRHIRDSDVASFDPKTGCFVLVLPECGVKQAQTACMRFARLLSVEHALEVQSGIAVFPDNALVLDDLVDAAIRHCDGPQPIPGRGET